MNHRNKIIIIKSIHFISSIQKMLLKEKGFEFAKNDKKNLCLRSYTGFMLCLFYRHYVYKGVMQTWFEVVKLRKCMHMKY